MQMHLHLHVCRCICICIRVCVCVWCGLRGQLGGQAVLRQRRLRRRQPADKAMHEGVAPAAAQEKEAAGLQQVGRGELAGQAIARRPEAAQRARLAIAALAISLAIGAPLRGRTVGGRQVGRRHEGAQPAWWWWWWW